MGWYTHNPTLIEAMQVRDDESFIELIRWTGAWVDGDQLARLMSGDRKGRSCEARYPYCVDMMIPGNKGRQAIRMGDWIVRDKQGGFDVINEREFEENWSERPSIRDRLFSDEHYVTLGEFLTFQEQEKQKLLDARKRQENKKGR